MVYPGITTVVEGVICVIDLSGVGGVLVKETAWGDSERLLVVLELLPVVLLELPPVVLELLLVLVLLELLPVVLLELLLEPLLVVTVGAKLPVELTELPVGVKTPKSLEVDPVEVVPNVVEVLNPVEPPIITVKLRGGAGCVVFSMRKS